MLTWSLTFLVVALVAALFGFGGIAAGATAIAQVCFFFFLVAFLASLIWQLAMGRRSAPPL
ncbi:MAG TPA: DUF1328 family protein [Planctomycetota bacterium]|nr:DUF1328 family protein [Planctomycetota bacterium]